MAEDLLTKSLSQQKVEQHREQLLGKSRFLPIGNHLSGGGYWSTEKNLGNLLKLTNLTYVKKLYVHKLCVNNLVNNLVHKS